MTVDNAKSLMEALSLLETIPCSGKEYMTRMLIAMQRISAVATSLVEAEKSSADKE